MFRSSVLHALQRQHQQVAQFSRTTFIRQRRFHSLGVSEELIEQLRSNGLATPTPAQEIAIPLILRGESDVVIAAETGGGKTLSYLVPVLEHLRRHPLAMQEIHRPVALILTTSQELVGQIMAVLRSLDSDCARYTAALSSTNQLLPHRVCPLLVATPKALLRATKPKDFAFTQHIIVDEADMLLGGGFERDTKQIIATIRNQPLKKAELNQWTIQSESSTSSYGGNSELLEDEISVERRQTVFSAYATIPDYGKRSVREFIQHKFPDAQFAVTDDFHRTLPRLDLTVHHLEENASSSDLPRMELLTTILTDAASHDHDHDPGNTLVFANCIESADALYEYLTSTQTMTNVLLYHKEIPRDARQEILTKLSDPQANVVVVCTDIAARGLDTTTVRHVVQYEFANDVVSYIHRIGRTARAGSMGKVSSIVCDQNALVLSKIQDAGDGSLDGAFSRKRSLRKKVKKARREARETHQERI